jgi:hypothetical protein
MLAGDTTIAKTFYDKCITEMAWDLLEQMIATKE